MWNVQLQCDDNDERVSLLVDLRFSALLPQWNGTWDAGSN